MAGSGLRVAPVRSAFLGALIVCVLAGVGCGSKTGAVSGKVMYKNEPLPGGEITFHCQKEVRGQKEFTFAINADGTYSAAGLPDGPATVTVNNRNLQGMQQRLQGPNEMMKEARKRGGQMPKDMATKLKEMPGGISEEQKAQMMAGAGTMGKYVPINPKYAEPTTSGLSYTVKSGKQDGVDFTVQ